MQEPNLINGGFYPFWFWNARLQKKKIKSQIQEMEEQGIEGFFIHPRQGLTTPYLSESFFEIVDTAVNEAEKKELLVGLYDEYPYPSGVAGGEVVQGNPAFQATALIQKKYESEGPEVNLKLPRGRLLSLRAFPVENGNINWQKEKDLTDYTGMVLTEETYEETGLTYYNRKRYFANRPVPVLEYTFDKNIPHNIYVSVQLQVENFKYWDKYVDTLNPEAIELFMELTHSRYGSRYREKFGRSIFSIFTDEISPGWSPRLPKEFEREYGYSLSDNLTALQEKKHPRHDKVKYDLHELQLKLFVKAFEYPVQNWCNDNNLFYSGEKPVLRLSQLKYMDIPGCDPGHTKAGAALDIFQAPIRSNARAVASAAYFYDKPGSLCECYHSLGWSATIQDAKIIAEGLMLAGINYLVPHGFFYSTHGLKKHDAPPSFFEQMPYWPLFGNLTSYLKKLGRVFKDTYMEAPVLLLEPHGGVPDSEQLDFYENLLSGLLNNQINFQIVDTEMLEDISLKNGKLLLKDLKAGVLLVPPVNVIEPELKGYIEDFREDGLKVVTTEKNNDIEKVLEEIQSYIKPELDFSFYDSESRKHIYSVKRVGQKQTVWFILNTTQKTKNLCLKPKKNFGLKEIKLEDKKDRLTVNDSGAFLRTMQPFESVLLQKTEAFENEVREGELPGEPSSEQPDLPVIEIFPEGRMDIECKNSNLLHMYDWEMALLDKNGDIVEKHSVPAVPLNEQLARGNFRFWTRQQKSFGSDIELEFAELHLNYFYTFYCNTEKNVEFVLEPGSIKGDWKIIINNDLELQKEDFKPTLAHTAGSLGCDISSSVQQGENKIKVDVRTQKGNQGLLNPLYLAGDFGVNCRPPTLKAPLEAGMFEQYSNNLIPYYSGVIEYRTSVNIENIPRTDEVIISLNLPEHFNKAAEVSLNQNDFKVLSWKPRCFKLKTSELNEGPNRLVIRVYTSLIRSFEAAYFDYNEHIYKSVD